MGKVGNRRLWGRLKWRLFIGELFAWGIGRRFLLELLVMEEAFDLPGGWDGIE